MKIFLFFASLFGMASLFGQQSTKVSANGDMNYRLLGIPEVRFFCHLYDDDYIGDTLSVDGKNYFFSQSPMKQFAGYMMGQTDNRLVLSFGKRTPSYGKADKGYVLHFNVKKNGIAQIDRSTYNGCIYPENYNNKPMQLNMIAKITGETNYSGTLTADWLDGSYRINDMQSDPVNPYKGKRYIAVFKKGKLIEIRRDEEKENFNPPLINLNEKPKDVIVPDFVPEYVYYKSSEGFYKESIDVTTDKWRKKLMETYQSEPFLDRQCGEALAEAWIKK